MKSVFHSAIPKLYISFWLANKMNEDIHAFYLGDLQALVDLQSMEREKDRLSIQVIMLIGFSTMINLIN